MIMATIVLHLSTVCFSSFIRATLHCKRSIAGEKGYDSRFARRWWTRFYYGQARLQAKHCRCKGRGGKGYPFASKIALKRLGEGSVH